MTDTTMTPLVFADCETTSLDARRRLAWDIALIRRDQLGESVYQFYVEVDLADADPFALRIGKFWDRHPLGRVLSGQATNLPDAKHGLSPGGFLTLNAHHPDEEGNGPYVTQAAAALLVSRITHGAHIVGAIPSFDTDTFQRNLFEHNLTPSWHHHIIDIEALAVGFLKGREAERDADVRPGGSYKQDAVIPLPWKSDDLTTLLGVEPCPEELRHTALGDALWAMRMYDAVMGPR